MVRARLLLLCLALLACRTAAVDTQREELIGFTEKEGVAGGAGGGDAGAGGEANAIKPPELHNADPDTKAAAASGGSGAGGAPGGNASEPSWHIDLHTQFGTIPLRVYPDISPKTARMVWDLAVARGCTHATCKFYRNEAKPAGGEGPPYALLQGQMNIAEIAVSGEGAVEVSTGHVAFIPNTKEWFVAYGEHPEWGKSHVVVGQVNDWFAVDLLIQQRYKKFTHPEHGTVMRLLLNEVPFRISVKGDKTYTDAIGPLKD